jgi:hypothetical protein
MHYSTQAGDVVASWVVCGVRKEQFSSRTEGLTPTREGTNRQERSKSIHLPFSQSYVPKNSFNVAKFNYRKGKDKWEGIKASKKS